MRWSIKTRKQHSSLVHFKNRLSRFYYSEIRSNKESLSLWNKWCYTVKMAKSDDKIEAIYNKIKPFLHLTDIELGSYTPIEVLKSNN